MSAHPNSRSKKLLLCVHNSEDVGQLQLKKAGLQLLIGRISCFLTWSVELSRMSEQ